MSVLYEVNLKIAKQIYHEYLNWLHAHIEKMCQHKGFKRAQLYEIPEADPSLSESKTCELVVQYHVASREDLENYFSHHAALMRQEAIDLFSDQFHASRRILTLAKEY